MLLPLNALFYFMPVKKVYITKDKEFELTIEKDNYFSIIIKDDKLDASSKSCELIFDTPTIRAIANEINEKCQNFDYLQLTRKS
jgi:hypothetical protein